MLHPSRPNGFVFSAVAKGLGINQTAVNPAWECKSYPKNILYFKTGDVTQQERLRPRPRWPKSRLGEWRALRKLSRFRIVYRSQLSTTVTR